MPVRARCRGVQTATNFGGVDLDVERDLIGGVLGIAWSPCVLDSWGVKKGKPGKCGPGLIRLNEVYDR
ncbi:MAG: hypothetical protein ACE5E5_11270 [Phycisphaerae bacterium]